MVYNLPMAWIINRPLSLAVALCICCIGGIQAQSDPVVSVVPRSTQAVPANAKSFPEVHLRVDTSLVLVPVQATSRIGTSITDLTDANFRVFEDGVEQKVTYFAKQDAPLSVGLVFDSSGSMTHKIRKSAEAAAAFFKTANTGDEFFLVEFGERPKLMMPFTPDSDEIYRKIVQSRPFGRTSLIDAIHMALIQMKNARHTRKAIVILSDGGDNRSRLTRREIKSALLESDVQMYAMGIFDRDDPARQTPEEENGPRLLAELAAQTGGRVYPVDNLDDLPSISSTLGNALRNEYLLGYVPSNESRDGKYRQVKVKLTDGTPNLNVSYRHGYYAPAQ
jgi:Ca-activated chloride channel homolog